MNHEEPTFPEEHPTPARPSDALLNQQLQSTLQEVLQKGWWVFLLRGVLGIIVALLFWLSPLSALLALMYVFATFALIDGGLGIYSALKEKSNNPHWWMLLLEGISLIIIALITFFLPSITAMLLAAYLAVSFIFLGAWQIGTGIKIRKEINNEFLLILLGALAIIIGIIFIIYPLIGILSMTYLIGFFSFAHGCLLIALAFKIKK